VLYAEVVGPSWNALPLAVQRVHGPGRARGTFAITRGGGLLEAVAATLFRLPAPAAAAPVTLEVTESDGGQSWDRHFGATRLLSTQHRDGTRIVERLGPVECVLEAMVADGHLRMRSVGAALRLGPWRLPLPAALSPRIDADATAAGAQVAVVVDIHLGRRPLMRYAGLVAPA